MKINVNLPSPQLNAENSSLVKSLGIKLIVGTVVTLGFKYFTRKVAEETVKQITTDPTITE